MSRFYSVVFLTCMLALAVMLSGCAAALVVGGLAAAGGGGYAAAQERGVGGAIGDLELQSDVERAFVDAGPRLREGITTTVYQGRVMLTGRVATPDMKVRAAQVAGRSPGSGPCMTRSRWRRRAPPGTVRRTPGSLRAYGLK
jgi:osmotically-inducible protein OsmY